MSNKINIPAPTCDKCGKTATINKEKSNDNWKVYDIAEPCECGGRFKINFNTPGQNKT